MHPFIPESLDSKSTEKVQCQSGILSRLWQLLTSASAFILIPNAISYKQFVLQGSIGRLDRILVSLNLAHANQKPQSWRITGIFICYAVSGKPAFPNGPEIDVDLSYDKSIISIATDRGVVKGREED